MTRSTRKTTASRRAWLILMIAVVAPALILLAGLGTRSGLWDWSLGYSVLAMQVGFGLAIIGAVAAIVGLVMALKDFQRNAIPTLLALVIAGGTLGALVYHKAQVASGGDAWDVTTSPGEPPWFGDVMNARRAGSATLGQPEHCASISTLPTQVAPQTAMQALKNAGFRVVGAAAFRAEGERLSPLFGFGYDAVIRIRPGETDIRVSARVARPDGGEACRLMREIHEGLESAS